MRASFMAVGGALLALGGALIVLGPIYASLAIAGSVGLGYNTSALTWGLLLSILGVMLSPLGAGVLAYGIGARDQTGMA
jgi:hypothetical protein